MGRFFWYYPCQGLRLHQHIFNEKFCLYLTESPNYKKKTHKRDWKKYCTYHKQIHHLCVRPVVWINHWCVLLDEWESLQLLEVWLPLLEHAIFSNLFQEMTRHWYHCCSTFVAVLPICVGKQLKKTHELNKSTCESWCLHSPQSLLSRLLLDSDIRVFP